MSIIIVITYNIMLLVVLGLGTDIFAYKYRSFLISHMM